MASPLLCHPLAGPRPPEIALKPSSDAEGALCSFPVFATTPTRAVAWTAFYDIAAGGPSRLPSVAFLHLYDGVMRSAMLLLPRGLR